MKDASVNFIQIRKQAQTFKWTYRFTSSHRFSRAPFDGKFTSAVFWICVRLWFGILLQVLLFNSFFKDEKSLDNNRLVHFLGFPDFSLFHIEMVCIEHDLNPLVQLLGSSETSDEDAVTSETDSESFIWLNSSEKKIFHYVYIAFGCLISCSSPGEKAVANAENRSSGSVMFSKYFRSLISWGTILLKLLCVALYIRYIISFTYKILLIINCMKMYTKFLRK